MRKKCAAFLKQATDTGMLHSAVIFLFYLSILTMNQFAGAMVRLFYYAMAIGACYLGLFADGKQMRIPKEVTVFALLTFLTGIANILLVGNLDLMKLFYTIVSVGIALVLLNGSINSNALLAAVLVNAAAVVIRLLIHGMDGPFYISSSANYVSVHLLLAAVVYYSVLENQNKKIPLWPAALIWVLCLLAKGRAGILFSTFFLGCLVLHAFVFKMRAVSKRTRRICCGTAGALIVIAVVCFFALDLVHKIPLFQRFAMHGLSGNGRDLIWTQYFQICASDLKALIFAPNLETMFRAAQQNGNVHNSFINVHAFNGIVMLAAFLAMCVNTALYVIKKGRWIVLICFITICLRGFTDFVFWGASGTPIMLYFLLLPIVETQKWGVWELNIPQLWGFVRQKLLKEKDK